MRRFIGIIFLLSSPCLAAAPPHACVNSQSLGTFKLSVVPLKGGTVLALGSVNALHKGQNLLYEPVHIPPAVKNKAEIALLLAPAANSDATLEALKPAPADKSTVWVLPRDASVIALVYGPQGLSMRKVKAMVQKNDEVLAELADYADQTAQVSALIQELQIPKPRAPEYPRRWPASPPSPACRCRRSIRTLPPTNRLSLSCTRCRHR